MDTALETIDCACVIHGDAYDWIYVERLHNMLNRHLTPKVKLHVYTEANRPVSGPLIKHALEDWNITGPKRSWWYKMQLFNTAHHRGPLLYFDLDVIILDNIDWVWQQNLRFFWAIQDFKYLWRPTHQGINSSVMWWNTANFDHVWRDFKQKDFKTIIKAYHGDQDYISQMLDPKDLRFLPQNRVASWRWQCLDGGYNFKQRIYRTPGAGTIVPESTDILIFHGKPKPSEISDPVIQNYWQ